MVVGRLLTAFPCFSSRDCVGDRVCGLRFRQPGRQCRQQSASGDDGSAPAPHNGVLDLTVPSALEPQTDAEIFDESVVFAPNFAVNQNDPALSDLFTKNGVSNLCFPTALTEDLIYLYAYHQPAFNELRLAGLSSNGRSIDPNALIRQLASSCKTDPVNGTVAQDAINCVAELLTQSGYNLGATQLISPFDTNSALPIATRDVTIADIRGTLKTGIPILLEFAWYKYDPASHTWARDSGHYISAFGYDYDESWGENQIQLKVINPETNYGPSRQNSNWDTITLTRVSPQSGITYPPDRPFIVSGSGFGGLTERGFLGMMIVVSPN